jgi:hypothetical protein
VEINLNILRALVLDEVALARVVAGQGVEDDGDQGPDILDIDGLGMEVGDGGDLIRVIDVGGGRVWLGETRVAA